MTLLFRLVVAVKTPFRAWARVGGILPCFMLLLPWMLHACPAEAASPVWLHRNAPSAKTLTISLPLVTERAMQDNLNVLTAKNRVGIAQGGLIQSFAPLFPSFRGLYSVETVKGWDVNATGAPVAVDRTIYRPTIFADYTIQTGGKPLFQIWAAGQQYQRSRLAVSGSGQKALLDACTGYFNWLRDIERERLAESALSEARSRMKLASLRLEAGVGARLEILKTQVQVRDRENDLLSIRNQRDFSAVVLLNHLNLPLDLALQPDGQESLTPISFWPKTLGLNPEDVTPEALFREAEANRPDVKALTTQIREMKAQLGAAWADLFPTVTLSGYARRIGSDLDQLQKTRQGAFSISVDVLRNMGVSTIGGIRSATARVRDAALNRAKQLQDIQQSISQALLDYRLYRNQLEVEQERCRAAEETYNISKARAEAGLALEMETIEAETARVSARMTLQTAVANYNIAQLRLLYETGQLTPDAILTAQANTSSHGGST